VSAKTRRQTITPDETQGYSVKTAQAGAKQPFAKEDRGQILENYYASRRFFSRFPLLGCCTVAYTFTLLIKVAAGRRIAELRAAIPQHSLELVHYLYNLGASRDSRRLCGVLHWP
jgi:hypothetical protein